MSSVSTRSGSVMNGFDVALAKLSRPHNSSPDGFIAELKLILTEFYNYMKKGGESRLKSSIVQGEVGDKFVSRIVTLALDFDQQLNDLLVRNASYEASDVIELHQRINNLEQANANLNGQLRDRSVSLEADREVLMESLRALVATNDAGIAKLTKLIDSLHLSVNELCSRNTGAPTSVPPGFTTLCDDVKLLRDAVDSGTLAPSRPINYADAVKAPPPGPALNTPCDHAATLPARTKATLLCKQSSSDGPTIDVLRLLRNSLDLSSTNIKILDTRTIRGGIALDFQDPESLSAFENLISEDSSLASVITCSRPKLRAPQFIVKNLPGDIEGSQLLEELIDKNEVLSNCSLTFGFTMRTGNQKHLIFTALPDDYFCLISITHLYLGWSRHAVSEFISVRQCSSCMALGHTRGHCPHADSPRCSRCGSAEAHDRRNCGLSCVNCVAHNRFRSLNLDVNHSSRGISCPLRAKAIKDARKYIDYGPP